MRIQGKLRKWSQKSSIVYFVIIIVTLIFFAACTNQVESKVAEADPNLIELNQYQLKQLTLDTVHFEPEMAESNFGGKVSFDNDHVVPVFSFVSGNVLRVPVSFGDYVKKGQVLATLRSSDLSNNQTQLDAAKAQLQLAKRTYDVAQELFKTKVYSELDVLTAKAAYIAAEDAVIGLETTMKTYGISDSAGKARNNIYNIVAPCDGYVVGKSLSEGSSVLEGTNAALFGISDLKNVWVLFNIFESDIYQVHVGDPVVMETIAYPGKTFNGIISKISNSVDSTAGTLQARVVLQNPDDLLRAGMFVSTRVHIDKGKRALSIPKECLVYYDNEYYVVVSKSKYVFEKRKVVVEAIGADKAYISKGVKENEVLVGKGSLYALGQ